MNRLYINREDELKLFAVVLDGMRPETAFLVSGESGSGKSALLSQFRRLARQAGRRSLLIDFRSGPADAFVVLTELCDGLGGSCFPACREKLAQIRPLSVDATISRNIGIGRTDIHQTVNLPPFSVEEQRWQAGQCTATFFDELRCLPPPAPVLLFDTCEQALPETLAWLQSLFLFLAHPERTPGLVVVVAGQRLPELSSEWDEYCCRMPLADLRPDHWCDCARRMRADLSEETVRAFHKLFKGLPAAMVNTLSQFAPGGGGQ